MLKWFILKISPRVWVHPKHFILVNKFCKIKVVYIKENVKQKITTKVLFPKRDCKSKYVEAYDKPDNSRKNEERWRP